MTTKMPASPDSTSARPEACGKTAIDKGVDRGLVAGSVAAAVDRVADVRLSGGSGVEVSTQYRHGRVLGVSMGDTEVRVQVVAQALPLEPLVASVRDAALGALQSLSDPREVKVVVDDLDVRGLPLRQK